MAAEHVLTDHAQSGRGLSLRVSRHCFSTRWEAPLITGRPLFFEAATVIVVLVLMGQWLESRGRAKAGTALRELLDLTPATALLVSEGTADREVAVSELLPGNRLQIFPRRENSC